jgi:hypothetical protein
MLPLHTTVKSIAFVLLFVIIFASCSNKSKKDIDIINALNESIENSNTWIERSNKDYMISFEEKLRNAGSSERAHIWYPKAKKIEQLSNDILNYVESIKNGLGTKVSFSSELFDKLVEFKKDILSVDPKIDYEFQKSLRLFTKTIDSSAVDQKSLFLNYFNNTSTSSVLAMLTKLQNNIRVIENKVIIYCYEHVGSTDGDGFCTFISAVTGISSSFVQPGESLEIFSGIGSFISDSKPEVFVYGKPIPINESAIAVYKFKAEKRPGKYYIPIKIKYTDQDGKAVTVEKEIEYTVANIQHQ